MGEEFTVRAAVSADLGPVAAICAHYVTTTVTTFEEVPPTAADWRRRSVELHRRLGFTHVGLLRRVGRKHGRWIDTALMQRELGTGD